MVKLRGLLYRLAIVLIIVLVISNIIFAGLHFSKQTHAYSELEVEGEIEVYDADGVTPILGYGFPLFSGGAEHTFHQSFFINNTGIKPVDVYWNISASSILWQLTGSLHQYVYDHHEDGIWKYSLGIKRDVDVSPQYWQPNQEAIPLAVGEGVKLQFELHYTGRPNTAETFTLTVSFHGNAPSILGDVNGDGKVDVFDLYTLGKAYNSTPETGNWNPNADLNNDLIINAEDLRILNDNYGHSV
jgi:hypothetical protein